MLLAEIRRLEGAEVTPEMRARYDELKQEIAALNSEMARLESNPYVIDRMHDEAKTEENARRIILDCAERPVRLDKSTDAPWDVRIEITRKIVGEFLRIELSPISDSGKFQDAARCIHAGMQIVSPEQYAGELKGELRRGRYDYEENFLLTYGAKGALLRHLLGRWGQRGSIDLLLGHGMWRKRTKEERAEFFTRQLQTYYPIYNLLAAYSEGLGQQAKAVMGGDAGFSPQALQQTASQEGVTSFSFEEIPLVPNDATPEERERIIAKFEAEKSRAREIGRKVDLLEKTRTVERLQREKLAISEGELREAQETLRRAEEGGERAREGQRQLIEQLEELRGPLGIHPTEPVDSHMETRLAGIRDHLENKMRDNQRTIWDRDRQLGRLGPLNWFAMRRLEGEKEEAEREIAAATEQHETITQAITIVRKLLRLEQQPVERKNEWKRNNVRIIEGKIEQIDQQIQELTTQIQGLEAQKQGGEEG